MKHKNGHPSQEAQAEVKQCMSVERYGGQPGQGLWGRMKGTRRTGKWF
jgi:hypothetical protein